MRKSIPPNRTRCVAGRPDSVRSVPQGQDQSKNAAQAYKPSADTPAKQKERNGDYSKLPGMPGNKSGPAAQQSR